MLQSSLWRATASLMPTATNQVTPQSYWRSSASSRKLCQPLQGLANKLHTLLPEMQYQYIC